jgi:hypothetical protein
MGFNLRPDAPQSIILICESPSRQQALKALLRTAFKDVSILMAKNYQDAGEILVAKSLSNALVVIDNWSVAEDPEVGCKHLKTTSSDTYCLVLLRHDSYVEKSSFSNVDAILEGIFSGSQFIETVQKLVV